VANVLKFYIVLLVCAEQKGFPCKKENQYYFAMDHSYGKPKITTSFKEANSRSGHGIFEPQKNI